MTDINCFFYDTLTVSTVDAAQSGLQSKGSGVGEDVWKGPAKVTVDKTR